ncbi:MAG TPA: YchJ family metal-binding protein [Marmoricola sp.]|nr:YchJ family metal-binding protein [Marmoricola sp.]
MRCPCGESDYAQCCEPLHQHVREATTPLELMRSRYSAYALDLHDYVFRTWHPRTRPEEISDTGTWTSLEILDATDTEVEFKAYYPGGVLHERSRFELRRDRWVYVDGTVL